MSQIYGKKVTNKNILDISIESRTIAFHASSVTTSIALVVVLPIVMFVAFMEKFIFSAPNKLMSNCKI